MDNGLSIWLEAPLSDELLGQYAELSRKLVIHIVPDGYSYYSLDFIRKRIEAGSWDAARFDTTKVGGISKSLKRLMIVNDASLPRATTPTIRSV